LVLVILGNDFNVLGKHPDTSIIATLDEQGKLVFPKDKAFTPDSSVRINIVGHSEALEKVGATKLANYTDQRWGLFANIFCKFLTSFKVWLLQLSSTCDIG
jgi:hypothetical protein